MSPMEPLARAFINRFQGGFPLARRPFSTVAARLGTTEASLILTIDALLTDGFLSRFGPLYDIERAGGSFTLAALAVPEARFDAVAASVNALPEVAHNYRREHALNMWFVVATTNPAQQADVLAEIARRTGLEVHDFPKRREFYLGLRLVLAADGGVRTTSFERRPRAAPPLALDPLDRRLIAATQAGLPLDPDPWAVVAAEIGCRTDEVLARLGRMAAGGLIRRIGAVPNHYRLGLRANAMTVWDLPDAEVAEVGLRLGALDCVSHCYERPRQPPRWPYNLFVMVHAPTRAEADARVAQLAARVGPVCRGHAVLYSGAVLKKSGLRLAV